MIINFCNHKHYQYTRQTNHCLPFKKIHTIAIFDLCTVRTCTIKHDKSKTHEKNHNCQQTIVKILDNAFFPPLFFFSFFPLFFTSCHIYTPHRILTARYSEMDVPVSHLQNICHTTIRKYIPSISYGCYPVFLLYVLPKVSEDTIH